MCRHLVSEMQSRSPFTEGKLSLLAKDHKSSGPKQLGLEGTRAQIQYFEHPIGGQLNTSCQRAT